MNIFKKHKKDKKHVNDFQTPANFIRFVTVRSFSKDYIFPVLLVFFNTVGNPDTPSFNAFCLLLPFVISTV